MSVFHSLETSCQNKCASAVSYYMAWLLAGRCPNVMSCSFPCMTESADCVLHVGVNNKLYTCKIINIFPCLPNKQSWPFVLSQHIISVFLLLLLTWSSVIVRCCFVKAQTSLPNDTSLLRIPRITLVACVTQVNGKKKMLNPLPSTHTHTHS